MEATSILQVAKAWKARQSTSEEYAGVLASILCSSEETGQLPAPQSLVNVEPIAASVLEFRARNGVLENQKLVEKLLLHSLQGSFVEACSVIDILKTQGIKVPIQILLTIAAACSSNNLFDFCIHSGGEINNFVDSALDANSSPDILEGLFQKDWRNIRTRINALNKYLNNNLDKGSGYVKALLEHGATIEPETFRVAACTGDAEVVELLIKTSRNHAATSGALQSAIRLGKKTVVEALLKHGVDPDTAEPSRASFDARDGRPLDLPLHEAVDIGASEMVELLLGYGASASVNGRSAFVGTTARDLAKVRGDERIMRLLGCE